MAPDETKRPAADESIKRRVLTVTIIGAGIVFLDSSVANVALPAIQRDLGISTSMQQWVASAYLLTLSVLLLVGGRLADLFGRKRMFVTGMAAYATLAAAAGLAPSGLLLVAARGVQGIAGAVLVPTTLALINSAYPAKERGRAIGTWAAWSGITTILGPVLGGFVIDNASWRYAFFITPTLALLALLMTRGVPEYRDEEASTVIDWVGIVLLVLSLGGMVFALIQGPIAGWTAPEVLVAAVVGALLVPVFLLWERTTGHPVMPFELFSNRNLVAANAVTFFVYAGLYGCFFYVPLYVQSTLGLSATIAGGTFIPTTVALFVLSPQAGKLNDRFGPRWLMCFGPLGAAAGLVIMSLTGPNDFWTVLVPGVVLFGIGLGFTVTPVTATAIGAAEERFSGVASGFNNAVSRVAGLIAIALMGVIVVQLWHLGIETAGADASAPVHDALYSVQDQAFVIPSTEGFDTQVAREVGARATKAGQIAFRYGMMLAALLVALGGVISAIWVRKPEEDLESHGSAHVACVGGTSDAC